MCDEKAADAAWQAASAAFSSHIEHYVLPPIVRRYVYSIQALSGR